MPRTTTILMLMN